MNNRTNCNSLFLTTNLLYFFIVMGGVVKAQQRIETGVGPMPVTWTDKDTGHKIVRLSKKESGGSSFYFHNNPFLKEKAHEGDLMVFTSRDKSGSQYFSVNLKTHEIKQLTSTASKKGGEIVAALHREVIFQSNDSIMACSVDTRAVRLLYVFPAGMHASVSTLNADETVLAGSYSDGDSARNILKQFPEKKDFFDRIYNARLLNTLFTVNLTNKTLDKIHSENTWLGHVQFSPADPNLLMFCHEGPWHKVDRIWNINIQSKKVVLVHKRTVEGEIAGHEFFAPDGKTIWFDNQVPRSTTFFLTGATTASLQENRYEMTRNDWSIHFNISPDQRLFAGDGGDPSQVAKAEDGMWIYLFTPQGTHFSLGATG